ncbi:MAG: hypothetical protein KGY56_11045 [Desulfobacterales bacterium]|nr:hypothetical protein [Desulfobacterales bacterium]
MITTDRLSAGRKQNVFMGSSFEKLKIWKKSCRLTMTQIFSGGDAKELIQEIKSISKCRALTNALNKNREL